MALPNSIKELNIYSEFYFFMKCVKCDCRRKHLLYVAQYDCQVFVDDDCDGITTTEYREEVRVICGKCNFRSYSRGLKYFTDDDLRRIKEDKNK